MEFVDIAGLVAGASKGEGLGNKFLANIREMQAIIQVVRCFDDDNIVHVSGRIDPISDIEIINTELCLADLEIVNNALNKANKLNRSGNKNVEKEVETLEKLVAHLNKGLPIRTIDISGLDNVTIKNLSLLTQKPILYIANIEENGSDKNLWLEKIRSFLENENSQLIPICATVEAEVSELDDEDEKKEFLKAMGMSEPGLDLIINAGYKLLGLQNYFTAGPKEVRAWTTPIGITAQRAAGVIHTDFEKGFIRAEVTSYDDYIEYSGEQGAKEAGKYRSEGREYIVNDGDVILFRFNV